MIRSVYDVASVIAKYHLSVTNIEFYAMRKSKEKERMRSTPTSSGDLRNGSYTHDRMRVSLHASRHSRVESWFWAPAHGPWPLMRVREKKEWAVCPPRKRVSRSMKGRREIKRDGRHPSLIDEHRSHWDVPERRSNKARARINARERSRERNTCLFRPVDTLKRSGPRGEEASWPLIHIHSRAKQTDRASSIGDDDLYEVIEID